MIVNCLRQNTSEMSIPDVRLSCREAGRMKIVINAVNLTESGARSVAVNFLKAYTAEGWEDELIVYVPPGRGYEVLGSPRVEIRTLPRLLQSPMFRYLASRRWWQKMLCDERPDVVFNMGNYALSVSVPQVTLFHWPYAIYPESEVWQRMEWRDRIKRRLRCVFLRRQLPFTSAMIAQTKTAAGRLRRLYGIEHVRVVPNAVSLQESCEPVDSLPVLGPRGARIRLLCFSRYNPHKNLEALLPVAKKFKNMRAPFQIILTVGLHQHRNAPKLLERIEREQLGDYLWNIGPIEMHDVPRLYASVDALLFPTLLESFSQTYIEAMHFGKPIFTSDRDFARDVCGDAAFYFNPNDANDILQTVTTAYENPDAISARTKEGARRVAAMPHWPRVAGMFRDILREVAG